MITVTRDGKAVATVEDDNAASVYIMRHQGMSTEWAVKNEGWGAVDEDGRDVFEAIHKPWTVRP